MRGLDYFWAAALALILIAVVLHLAESNSEIIDLAASILTAVTILISFMNYLINRWEIIYLLYKKTMNMITNAPMQISWNTQISGEFTDEDLEVVKTFLQIDEFKGEVIAREPNQLVILLPQKAIHVRVKLDFDISPENFANEGSNSTYDRMIIKGDTPINFRQAPKLIEEFLVPFMESLHRRFDAKWEVGYFDIKLSEDNPYWDVMIKRLPRESVSYFAMDLQFPEPDGKRKTVTVGKDKISIMSETESGYGNLAKRFISLGGLSSK